MMLFVFLRSAVGKVYKILPLKEEFDAGDNTHLDAYLDSLCCELGGALDTFPELRSIPGYISVLNTAKFLSQNDFDHAVCKREVFKMIRLLQQIENEIGGDCCV